MTIKLVSDGQEPMIREAVAWLERRGIAASEIQSVTVTATVGEPMILTAVLIVSDPDEVSAAEPELAEWHEWREKGVGCRCAASRRLQVDRSQAD